MSKIPELLTSLSGEKIDTVEKWEKFRRREILHLFEEYVYGVRDIERPENLRFEKKYEDIFCGMRRREIRAGFDSFQFPFTLYLPLEQTKTLPAFVLVLHENMENHSYFNKEGNLIFEDSLMPVKDITDRGFAVAVMPTRDLYRDWTAHEHYQHGVLAAVKTPGGPEEEFLGHDFGLGMGSQPGTGLSGDGRGYRRWECGGNRTFQKREDGALGGGYRPEI